VKSDALNVSCITGGSGPDTVTYLSQITVAPDENFCRVVERTTQRRLVVFDGVLIGQGRTAVIALQNRTTKAPRQYLIAPDRPGYAAKGMEAVFKPNSDDMVRALSGWIKTPDKEPLTGLANFGMLPEPRRQDVQAPEIEHIGVPRSIISPQPDSRPGIPKGETRPRLLERLASLFRRTPVRPPNVETPRPAPAPTAAVDPLEMLMRGAPKKRSERPREDQLQAAFLVAAERANEQELRPLIEIGADINEPDSTTGLTALHLLIGRNAMSLVQFLVERGAAFVPDKFGRMPSTIAAESEVSEELCDYIGEAEARAEGV
jgi:uncharacterized protein